MIKAAKDASKGVLGWLGGGDAVPPPLIPTSSFRDAPWMSYFALIAEDKSFEAFHSSLTQSLIKHPKIPLEQAIKVILFLLSHHNHVVFYWAYNL